MALRLYSNYLVSRWRFSNVIKYSPISIPYKLISIYSCLRKAKSAVIEDPIVVTDDSSTIVCWHPEKPFPYEFSRPLPEKITPVNSVLRVQNKSAVYEVFKQKSEDDVREELMKLTHTTKHRWYPNNRCRKSKPFKRDREFL